MRNVQPLKYLKAMIFVMAFAFLPQAALASGEITTEGAFAKATPAKVSVIYMRIHNETDQDMRLINVETGVADRVELHTIINEDGILKMREVKDGYAIPAKSTYDLLPNGDHIMLYGLKNPLKENDSFEAILHFDGGKTVSVLVNVRPITAVPDWLD